MRAKAEPSPPGIDRVRPSLANRDTAISLRREIERLRDDVAREAQETYASWRRHIVRPSFQSSALNLAHYLALRRRDLRELQPRLAALGLSSLGRCEARVMANLDALMATLSYIAPPPTGPLPHPLASDVFAGDNRLHQNAAAVLGRLPPGRGARIMVTLPSEAANDAGWMENLLRSGADAVRINCAHDGPDEWARMVENVHLAEKRTARRCRIMMDLAGPKPRTGEVRTPPDENRLHEGDSLLLSGNPDPRVEISPFQATCTSPEIIRQLQVGQRVLIDDGRMQSRVEVIYPAGVLLRIGGHLVKKTPQLRALQSWPMERNIRPGLDAGPVLISSRRTRGARSARCPV